MSYEVGDKFKVINVSGIDCGSHSYTNNEVYKITSISENGGLYVDSDDHDVRGIVIMPREYHCIEKVEDIKEVTTKAASRNNVSIQKLTKKVDLGYRFTTVDFVEFHIDQENGLFTVNDLNGGYVLSVDLTKHTLDSLSELIRYAKSDMDSDS